METQGLVSRLERTLDRSTCLWLLFVCIATFGVMCQMADAQDCAQCATNALLESPVSTGEWLLNKQVNEVNVLFVATRKGKAVGNLSLNDISVRDDDKPPTAILGFRTELELPLRVGVAIDTSTASVWPSDRTTSTRATMSCSGRCNSVWQAVPCRFNAW
jgi:hypothetical protein